MSPFFIFFFFCVCVCACLDESPSVSSITIMFATAAPLLLVIGIISCFLWRYHRAYKVALVEERHLVADGAGGAVHRDWEQLEREPQGGGGDDGHRERESVLVLSAAGFEAVLPEIDCESLEQQLRRNDAFDDEESSSPSPPELKESSKESSRSGSNAKGDGIQRKMLGDTSRSDDADEMRTVKQKSDSLRTCYWKLHRSDPTRKTKNETIDTDIDHKHDVAIELESDSSESQPGSPRASKNPFIRSKGDSDRAAPVAVRGDGVYSFAIPSDESSSESELEWHDVRLTF